MLDLLSATYKHLIPYIKHQLLDFQLIFNSDEQLGEDRLDLKLVFFLPSVDHILIICLFTTVVH